MRRIAAIVALLFLTLNVVGQTSAQDKVVYTTETGVKYHLESCRYLSKSKFKTTMAQAIAAGYGACKVCKPGGASSSTSKSKSSADGRCTATTKAGTRCKRSAAAGSSRCWQH